MTGSVGERWFGAEPRALSAEADASVTAISALREAAGEGEAPRLAKLLTGSDSLVAFLGAALSASSFLSNAFVRRPHWLEALFETPVEVRLQQILAAIGEAPEEETEGALMTRLRALKLEAHALIGLADLATNQSQATVRRLSDLADACVQSATGFLLRDLDRQGKLKLPDLANPQQGSGLIVLGMGKLGARELNFSSDIDLIVLFEPDYPAVLDPSEATETFARMTRKLVRTLQDRTGDGYVFRTDLRLRPDPGSTPLALPVEAALNYYEARGQNWERAAMIKARQVAGDPVAGARLLKDLKPYVWRKYMDFAAIADVHAIKRQIHAHRGHGDVAVRGHNVKLGRGGIREIEFFVQTQQLIAGGRHADLRGRETVAMLRTLADHYWITFEAADDLTQAYWFLRDVEHRIQILADEQTHLLPEEDDDLIKVAYLCGFDGIGSFDQALRRCLRTVERHYAALFEAAPALSTEQGNLVFTGDNDDPDTVATLGQLGFERPADISRLIRGWHYGRYRSTRSAEARERLTELTPALLEALASTGRADDAAIRFDAFIERLPAGIQLFSLLHSNPGLLRQLVTIMGAAPRLAETIAKSPHVFDGLLDPALLSELPNKAYLGARLTAFLDSATAYEDRLDRLRIFANEQRFLIGVRLLSDAIDATRAGKAFSDLADLILGQAFDAVSDEFARRHGKITGQRVAIVGLGKLGSRELTASSDVDLILLYDHEGEESDGEKPLAASLYFARLTQRLIAAVSAPTAEGVLYELDLRLRPSGNKGPVATHVDSFKRYQREEAWVWEHMALTRARPIAGDEDFGNEIAAEIAAILAADREQPKVANAAVEMRELLAKEKPPKDDWDLKLIPGGLIDLEFIAQVATLIGKLEPGEGRPTGTAATLARLSDDFADADTRDALVAAHGFYSGLSQVIRLCVPGAFERETMPAGLGDLLLRSTGLPDLAVLEAHLGATASTVREAFEALVRKRRRSSEK